MSASLLALEGAVRRGETFGGVEVILDELEARGALGKGDRTTELRERVLGMVRLRGAIWAQEPTTAIVDFYARTLDIPELVPLRAEWDAALDARGPWLRPLRAWIDEGDVRAELRTGESVALDRVVGLRFEGEEALVLGLGPAEAAGRAEQAECLRWAWPQARVERQAGLEPVTPRYRQDSRFERGEDAPRYRARPDQPARQLPWEEFGHARAQMSADGRTIFVFGWFDDNYGLLELVDEQSLAIRRRHEFDRPVAQVVERPGSDELLVETYGGLFIVNANGRQWHRANAGGTLAWSPSGRHVATVDARAARIIEVAEGTGLGGAGPAGGLPTSFSPEGRRLVDGPNLLDGRSGAPIARLDVHMGQYLEGGPASPWWHVGSELILNMHSGLQAWDVDTGQPIAVGDHLSVPSWEAVAYSRSGRHLVRGRGLAASVVELPAVTELAELVFGLEIEALALSEGARWVAAYGGGRVEVRARDNSLVGSAALPQSRSAEQGPLRQGGLEFRDGDRRLALDIPARTISGWAQDQGSYTETRPAVSCAWRIEPESASLIQVEAAARPRKASPWTIEEGAITRFVEDQTGVCLSVPCAGPWRVNPDQPQVFACPGGLFELRSQ